MRRRLLLLCFCDTFPIIYAIVNKVILELFGVLDFQNSKSVRVRWQKGGLLQINVSFFFARNYRVQDYVKSHTGYYTTFM